MANWKTKIEISDLHKRHEDGELEPKEVGKEVAARVRAAVKDTNLKDNTQLLDICERLEKDIPSEDEDEQAKQEYNDALQELYNWGDRHHRMWIAGFNF